MTDQFRNYIFDSIKFFCAFLVILIHADYPYKIYMQPITDVAVPLFFCISGYFIYGKPNKVSRIKKILYIMMWGFALYYTKTIVFQYLSNGDIFIPTFEDIVNFILYNHVVFALHLWYLAAYVYVLIIAWIINKYDKWGWAFLCVIPIVILGSIVKLNIGEINYTTEYFKWNNFVFLGIPYFFTGAFIKKNSIKLLFLAKRKFLMTTLIAISIIVRYMVAYRYSFAIITDLNRYFLVSLLFVFFVGCTQSAENMWSKLGNAYSLYIYIFHVLVYQVIEMFVPRLSVSVHDAYMYIHPLIVLLVTIVLVRGIRQIRLDKCLELR